MKMLRNSTPIPRIVVNTVPITTSSGRPRGPRSPRPMPTTTVAAKSPSRTSSPNASAASAPVNPTWLSASTLNTWLRKTTK
jgi:hypothetical protein